MVSRRKLLAHSRRHMEGVLAVGSLSTLSITVHFYKALAKSKRLKKPSLSFLFPLLSPGLKASLALDFLPGCLAGNLPPDGAG